MKLPLDIVSDIFLQLPPKSLLRFRCLSNPCCSLIDGPDFINDHLKLSVTTNSNTGLILKSLYLYSVSLDPPDSVADVLDIPLDFAGGTEAFGSSNGLVAFRNSDKENVLYNPVTKKHVKLPVEPIQNHRSGDISDSTPGYTFYGFGYDSVTHDYKILRMATFVDNSDIDVKVFSLRNNSWTKIRNGLPRYLRFMFEFYYHLLHGRGYGVFSNNVLHWMMPAKLELGILVPTIVGFELASQTFREVPLPDIRPQHGDLDPQIDLGVLKGCLCVVCNYNQTWVDIWMMKEYGVGSSWSKVFSLQRPKTVRNFSFLRPLAYSKDDEDKVLLELNSEKLVWYDLERKKFKTLRIDHAPDSFVSMAYVSSLVPLREEDESWKEQQEQEEKRQLCRKKRDDFLSVGFKLVL